MQKAIESGQVQQVRQVVARQPDIVGQSISVDDRNLWGSYSEWLTPVEYAEKLYRRLAFQSNSCSANDMLLVIEELLVLGAKCPYFDPHVEQRLVQAQQRAQERIKQLEQSVEQSVEEKKHVESSDQVAQTNQATESTNQTVKEAVESVESVESIDQINQKVIMDRLNKSPLKEFIQAINEDSTGRFFDERCYFKDLAAGKIPSEQLTGKWIAYVHGKWWKQAVYLTDKQVFDDQEFVQEIDKTKKCYIVQIGFDYYNRCNKYVVLL